MTTSELRREIKKIVDQLPPERLASLADYVHFLGRPPCRNASRPPRKPSLPAAA